MSTFDFSGFFDENEEDERDRDRLDEELKKYRDTRAARRSPALRVSKSSSLPLDRESTTTPSACQPAAVPCSYSAGGSQRPHPQQSPAATTPSRCSTVPPLSVDGDPDQQGSPWTTWVRTDEAISCFERALTSTDNTGSLHQQGHQPEKGSPKTLPDLPLPGGGNVQG
jgi:hypothetical protein